MEAGSREWQKQKGGIRAEVRIKKAMVRGKSSNESSSKWLTTRIAFLQNIKYNETHEYRHAD
jgi:hypothetical protein